MRIDPPEGLTRSALWVALNNADELLQHQQAQLCNAEARRDQLFEALEEFGVHKSACPVRTHGKPMCACDCGLLRALIGE